MPTGGAATRPCHHALIAQADGDWGLTLRDSPSVCIGVLVSHVYSGGAAAAAGLQPQDLIVAIGDEIVREAERVRSAPPRGSLRVAIPAHTLLPMARAACCR